MKTTIAAIYENGVFRPPREMHDLQDKEEVNIIIMKENHSLADCIGILSDEAAEEMRVVIEREFKKVDPDEWK
jgi:predicted DNA-binding antitoxin AbrB/MazE fold protein